MDPPFLTIAVFVFLLGTCVGSFLNVVIYRMPLNLSLVYPPSACPKCGHRLAAYDNVPILGWLWLRGKCRYCRNPISPRYPIVEAVTGLLFLFQFLMLFHYGWGPYGVAYFETAGIVQQFYTPLFMDQDWPILLLHLWLIAALLAASLIDLEHYIIPIEICWVTMFIGIAAHTGLRPPGTAGSLHFNPVADAATLGGAIGVAIAIGLLYFGVLKRSFADEEPLLEKDMAALPPEQRPDPWTAGRVRKEIWREVLFLALPIALALLGAEAARKGWLGAGWEGFSGVPVVSGALGSLCGALVGGLIVWFFRIAGSFGFGREAMGMGDVHLMLGIGAILGPGAAVVVFFLAPIFGLGIAVVQLLRRGTREIPYGPYLSLATLAVMLFYVPIYQRLEPGVGALGWILSERAQSLGL
jgi:leader peptidase (prepilin peptidase)/N-methyltransferase